MGAPQPVRYSGHHYNFVWGAYLRQQNAGAFCAFLFLIE